jgi:hypothetical protein
MEVREQCRVKIWNGFAHLENFDDDDDVNISRAWESIRKCTKDSATESLKLL